MSVSVGPGKPPPVLAAGALAWREKGGKLQVLLVHRPRYDDWSVPKGKLDKGETFPAAAVREVAEEVPGPDEVRLVGAELEEIKALRRGAGYLVEWDIPAEITMDQYLARKKANAPKYAEVPETSFLRPYVREATAKCLCFYDAPDEDAVVRAREAVSTPIDRIWALGAIELDTTGA